MDNIDFNKLWTNFADTVSNHYIDFNGRVGRAQFWSYIAVSVAVQIVAVIVGRLTFNFIPTAVQLLLFLPSLGMLARRLQDTGRPGNWAILLCIPALVMVLLNLLFWLSLTFLLFFATVSGLIGLLTLAGAAVIVYFCVQPGQPGANEYGPPPPAWSPNKVAAA
jgi:uncharacterized membrane protein YhaH (DUF805 family)